MGVAEQVDSGRTAKNILISADDASLFDADTAQDWQKDLFVSWLFQTCIRLQTSLDRRFLTYGMTMQEASILLRCVESHSTTPGKLAVVLGRDKGKITRFVYRLERSGLITRDIYHRDKRYSIIKPTKKAKQLARSLVQVSESIRTELFLGIQDSDLLRFGSTLRLLYKNASAIMAKPRTDPARSRRRIGALDKTER